MKVVLTFLFLILIPLLQNITEAVFYQLYRAIINNTSFTKFVGMVFRYFIYRFSLTIFPYIILIYIFRAVLPHNFLMTFFLSGILNLAIAAFFGLFVEGRFIFDTIILLFSLISSIVITFCYYFFSYRKKQQLIKGTERRT